MLNGKYFNRVIDSFKLLEAGNRIFDRKFYLKMLENEDFKAGTRNSRSSWKKNFMIKIKIDCALSHTKTCNKLNKTAIPYK